MANEWRCGLYELGWSLRHDNASSLVVVEGLKKEVSRDANVYEDMHIRMTKISADKHYLP